MTMKTIEQQKADLCDYQAIAINKKIDGGIFISSSELDFIGRYEAITYIPTKESTNPYIDEVFDMRICNVISDILNKDVKNIRLSDCPHINRLQNRKNIGIGSLQLYESTMQKYGLNDKLI